MDDVPAYKHSLNNLVMVSAPLPESNKIFKNPPRYSYFFPCGAINPYLSLFSLIPFLPAPMHRGRFLIQQVAYMSRCSITNGFEFLNYFNPSLQVKSRNRCSGFSGLRLFLRIRTMWKTDFSTQREILNTSGNMHSPQIRVISRCPGSAYVIPTSLIPYPD